MDSDKTFFTVTMAKLLNSQGRYEEASRIYRHLLDQDPDQVDIRQALEAAVDMIPVVHRQWESISGMIEKWVRLILKQRELRCLQQICLDDDWV